MERLCLERVDPMVDLIVDDSCCSRLMHLMMMTKVQRRETYPWTCLVLEVSERNSSKVDDTLRCERWVLRLLRRWMLRLDLEIHR